MSDRNLPPVMQAALLPSMPFKPQDGDIRANEADYDGIVIEMFGCWQSGEGWAVPAWEEMGRADLAGPFATFADAIIAVRKAA